MAKKNDKPKVLMIESEDKSFQKLYEIDCSDFIERKKGDDGFEASYLSWAWAWANFKAVHPKATYEIKKFDGIPYICDPGIGIMVYTEVTVDELTHEMWLPVMNFANKAMKPEPYEYTIRTRDGGKMTKRVEAATMTDINKAIMRCLVKNLAMFGLGLSIYAGEDIPRASSEEEQAQQAEPDAITVEEIKGGYCDNLVDWLAGCYMHQTADFDKGAIDYLQQNYKWANGAFDILINRTRNKLKL